jgi:Excalibur calcium-binding domain
VGSFILLLAFIAFVVSWYFSLSAFRAPWGRKLRALGVGLLSMVVSLVLIGSQGSTNKTTVAPKATTQTRAKPVQKKPQITKAGFSHQCKLLVIKKIGRRPADLRFNQLDSLGGQVIPSTFENGRKEYTWTSWASYKKNSRWMKAQFICMYNNERGVIVPIFKLERSLGVPADRYSAKPVRQMAKPRVVAKPKPRVRAVTPKPQARAVAPKPRVPVRESRPAYRGNVNCSSFSSWDEAQAFFIAYSVRKLDRDSDGIACESLR